MSMSNTEDLDVDGRLVIDETRYRVYDADRKISLVVNDYWQWSWFDVIMLLGFVGGLVTLYFSSVTDKVTIAAVFSGVFLAVWLGFMTFRSAGPSVFEFVRGDDLIVRKDGVIIHTLDWSTKPRL